MRILFFSESFGRTPFIDRQVCQIAQRHEVRYLCVKKYAESDSFQVLNNKFSYWWPIRKLRDRLEMHQLLLSFWNPSFSKFIQSQIKNFRPEIIHLQFGYEALKFIDNASNTTIPIIIHFRGYDASKLLSNRSYVKRLRRILAEKRTFSVFVCNHLLNNLRKKRITFSNPPEIVYSNTDTDFYQRKKTLTFSNSFRLIQVSNFREKKGHLYTLKALKKYLDDKKESQSIKLIFVGDIANGQYEAIYEKVNELKLNNHVEFAGFQTQDEIRRLLESCHCALLHSITASDGDQEGIPNALMEAMSMELPVITTKHAGISELLEDKNGKPCFGIMVAEKDEIAMRNAISQVIETWRLAPENRERIVSFFSKEKFIENIDSLYLRIKSAYN